MLDIGGTIECKIYQHSPGFFKIYIKAESLGIVPGEVILSNDKFLKPYRDSDYVEGDWHIRLYTDCAHKKNRNKRKFRVRDKIPDSVLAESAFYNEAVRLSDWKIAEDGGKWFIQNVKASIILPLIKEKSVIPNGLIYKDEYWKT